ncbi:MAG: hypothetical protein HY054_16210 [Proteobacteria bacterium]|nr:hypothetical protein [Pseudomonadota bacterium]
MGRSAKSIGGAPFDGRWLSDFNFRGDTLLGRLLRLYAVVLVAILLAGACVITFAIWPHYEQLERQESEHRLHGVLQAIQSEQDRLQELVNTNAVWDDAFQFVQDENPSFPAVNFSPEALNQIGVDAALVRRNDGSSLFSGGQQSVSSLVQATESAVANADGLRLNSTRDEAHALIIDHQGVAIVALRKIVRADGTGPSQGVLVFVRRVGPELLARMRALTGSPFLIAPIAQTGSHQDAVRIATTFDDAFSRPSISVGVLGSHEVLAVGRTTILALIIAAAIMLALLASGFAVALVSAVVSPVSALRKAVTRAAEAQIACATPQGAPADIADLATAFSAALAQARHQDELRSLAVTEKRIAEQANLAKSQFIANVSHELRTPLNAVIGYSEIIAENAADAGREDDVQDALRVVRAARSLLALINAILDFSKIEAGKMELSIETFDPEPLLQSVLEIAAPLASSKGLTLRFERGDELGRVTNDIQKLRQCLINLLSNAIKFTHQGEVVLRVSRFARSGAHVLRFEVIDTGIGIEESAQKRVFTPFSQADASISNRFGGTGLGLAITRDMVRLMGGRIGVKSTLGVGTRFVIELPAEAQPPMRAAA